MSQKSILSFFKTSGQTPAKDSKKQVVIEDSSTKKKQKRKVKSIESDEDVDSDLQSVSNNVIKDIDKGTKKKKQKVDTTNEELEDCNERKSEKQEKIQENAESRDEQSPEKMEVDVKKENENCLKNGGHDLSSKLLNESKVSSDETNENNLSEVIPKRKTARKKITLSKSGENNTALSSSSSNKEECKSDEKEKSGTNFIENGVSKEASCSKEEIEIPKTSTSDEEKTKKVVEKKKLPKTQQQSKVTKKASKKHDQKQSISNFFSPAKKLADAAPVEEETAAEIETKKHDVEDSPVKKTSKTKRKVQCLESDEEDDEIPEKSVEVKTESADQDSSNSQELNKKSTEIKKIEECESKENDAKSSVARTEESEKIEECESKEIDAKTEESGSSNSTLKTSPTKQIPSNDAKNEDKPKLGIKSTSASGIAYDPSKSNYHPIEDAIWKRGEKTPYLALAKTLECIENISGRLKAIETLSNFFRSVIVLSPDDLLHSVYLCLNRLAPEYEAIELGVGETLLMKAVAQATGRTVEKIKAEVAVKGDLGLVSESSRGNQRVMFSPPKLTVSSVFSKFLEIAKMSGNAAMAKKIDKIQSLFVACRDCEARYIIRSLSGKLRIGLAELSVLTALARAAVLTPPGQPYPPKKIDTSKGKASDSFKEFLESQTLILKTAYCECPNYDLIIPVLLEKGISALPECCQLSPGRPLKPMLAQPTTGIDIVLERFDKNAFTCEFKYDGERAQIHMTEKGEVKIFSRNQEDNTSKYPDVISRFSKCLKDSTKSFILDSEAVAWDTETKQILPFQTLSTRKRKDAVESEIVVKVCIMAFDLLYLNGESLVKKPLKERRNLLHSSFNEIENEFMFAQFRDGDSAETMQEFLDEAVKGSCEGLMVKALEVDASYEIAKRSHNWLKLKKDYLQGCGDTMDLVVIGGYYGKGKRTGTYGGFLLACYDEENEEFQSCCKLGTGFKDEDLKTHTSFLKEHVIEKPKSYYRYDHSLEPDVWFEPVQVWEIKCADLSISPVHKAAMGIVDPEKGISLRFPRYIRIREDKAPENCTDSKQIADMYKQQQQIQNTNKNVKNEEDYY